MSNLEKRVEELESAVAQLAELVAQMAGAGTPRPDPELLQRGKYSGRSRTWVMENDPGYVVYLSTLGQKTWQNWGFTEKQLQEAQDWVDANPAPPVAKPVYAKARPDSDPDVPF